MSRIAVISAVLFAIIAGLMGCSGGGGNPVLPGTPITEASSPVERTASSTHLWGFQTVSIDLESKSVTAVPDRSAMFTANVVTFLNSNPLSMSFRINEIVPGPDYTDVDINVALTHPFPGMPQYNGYDVRGIFMGDGLATLSATGAVRHPVFGTDQFMFDDPESGGMDLAGGGPDGYTRWFNRIEFSMGGMPMFSYTQGQLASPGFNGTATLCPYSYFADSLGAHMDLWDWITENADFHGQFSSGATNERNYYLRFPDAKGVTFGYAVAADWGGIDPSQHPSNAIEAVACDVRDSSNVYYIDSSDNGGSLILDLSIFDWHSQITDGVMLDYNLWIESTVLDAPYQLDQNEMTPTGGDDNYSTYHVELAANNVTGLEGNEYWVIVEYPGYGYSNDFGSPNGAGADPLAAYFRYDLVVSNSPGNHNPECYLDVVAESLEGWEIIGAFVEFDTTGTSDPDGDVMTYLWDFDGDGVFDEDPDDANLGTPEAPVHNYLEDGNATLRVEDGNGGYAECSVDVELTLYPSKNLPLRSGIHANDIGADPADGDLLVLYDDGQVWKHTASDFYQPDDAAKFCDFIEDWPAYNFAGLDFMDVGPDEWSFYQGEGYGSVDSPMLIYDEDGQEQWPLILYGTSWTILDMMVFGEGSDSYANDPSTLIGYIADWYNPVRYRVDVVRHPDPNYPTQYHTYEYAGENHTGYDKVYYEYIVAGETATEGDYCWILENVDFYASRWLLTGSGTYNDLDFASQYFGTGSQSEADTCWYNAKDITRDASDNYYVLDELSSGDGRVKVFTTGSPGTSVGGFDLPDDVDPTPLRLEGTDYEVDWFGYYLFVLHGGPGGYYLSIFFESEIPG